MVVWGIIGAGRISSDFANGLRAIGACIGAVAASDADRAAEFAQAQQIRRSYGSYEDLAADNEIDVVYIGTLHPQHKEHTMLCLNHGKHVLVEKPMSNKLCEAKEMIQLARSKNLFLMEAMWTRFFPAMRKARELINTGVIGDVTACMADFGFKAPPNIPRLFDKKLGGGALIDIGIYPLAVISMAYGGVRPTECHATGYRNEQGADVAGMLMLKYADKGLAQLHYSFMALTPETTVIVGTEGTIILPAPAHAPTKLVLRKGDYHKDNNSEEMNFPLPEAAAGPEIKFPHSQGLQYEALCVMDCLRKGLTECPEYTLEETLTVMEIMENSLQQMGAGF